MMFTKKQFEEGLKKLTTVDRNNILAKYGTYDGSLYILNSDGMQKVCKHIQDMEKRGEFNDYYAMKIRREYITKK